MLHAIPPGMHAISHAIFMASELPSLQKRIQLFFCGALCMHFFYWRIQYRMQFFQRNMPILMPLQYPCMHNAIHSAWCSFMMACSMAWLQYFILAVYSCMSFPFELHNSQPQPFASINYSGHFGLG